MSLKLEEIFPQTGKGDVEDPGEEVVAGLSEMLDPVVFKISTFLYILILYPSPVTQRLYPIFRLRDNKSITPAALHLQQSEILSKYLRQLHTD